MSGGRDLAGRVCVVTGGSRGLGRAIALGLADRGAAVVVASRRQDACDAVAAEISARGGQALAVATHVGRWADCDALHDRVLGHFGRADVLVNDAGSSPRYDRLVDVPEALFDKVLAVNLKGAFRLAVRFGTTMAEGRGGAILNVTSISAVQPGTGELPYAAAKAGLTALTLGLARSFGPTVRVNALMPGLFLTDVSAHWPADELTTTLRERVALGRAGSPEELVGAALHLVSDESSYTTGAVLKVDGGYAWAAA